MTDSEDHCQRIAAAMAQHVRMAYKQRLRASGSQELVRAWLDGDWSVTMGAFFDCWEAKRHVVAPRGEE